MEGYSSIQKRQAVSWLLFRFLGFIVGIGIVIGLYCIAKYGIVGDAGFQKEYESTVMAVTYAINSILIFTLFIYTFIMPFLQRAAWKYKISDDCIEVRFGVIIKRIQIVPEARIQHLVVARLITDRIFGLARVCATTSNGAVAIIGLSPKQAEDMARSVNDRVNTLVRREKALEEER